MLNQENKKALSDIFKQIILSNSTGDVRSWLEDKVDKINKEEKTLHLNQSFAQLPRIVGKQSLTIQEEQVLIINQFLPGFSLKDWTLDRLGRVWLLMQLTVDNKEAYIDKINSLFVAAEMNELVALYSSLPFLAYPEAWNSKCEDGIRSNIGTVLEAIMCFNPYPAQNLSELAWNQLVLKAFFTEQDVSKIVGLEERANLKLANTLRDYVEERLAAHRTVHPEIYKLIELGK